MTFSQPMDDICHQPVNLRAKKHEQKASTFHSCLNSSISVVYFYRNRLLRLDNDDQNHHLLSDNEN